jgi:hypothetical protein
MWGLVFFRGESAMPDYRLYWLNRAGHFIRAEEYEADDDAAAVVIARGLCGPERAELWAGARKVAVFPDSSEG